MTPKQEKALREYLRAGVVLLIEDVLVRKLGQALDFVATEVAPRKEWVSLTDDEVLYCVHGQFDQRNYWVKIGKAIEAKLKEKNT